MNVERLLKEDNANERLSDGNWKHTDYYEIDSSTAYFGCLNLITLSKQVTTDEKAALLYLFQRLYNGEVLNKDVVTPTASELLHWLNGAGYTGLPEGSNTGTGGSSQGVRLDTHIAAQKVQQRIQDQLQSIGTRVFKNGQEITTFSPLNAKEVIAITAFLDKEDEYLYFIETTTNWMYINGGTGA